MDFSVDGKRHRETIGPSKAEAEMALRVVEEDVRKRRFPMLNVSKSKRIHFFEIAEDFLEYAKVNKKPSGYQRDLISIQHFKNFFGDIRVSQVTPSLIERYKAERMGKVSNNTVHRELTCLKTMFSKAVQSGKASNNPVKRVRMVPDSVGRLRFLTKDEAQQLTEACDEVLRPIVVLALHTGMRRGEILGLKWEDVDWDNKALWIGEGKGGRGGSMSLLTKRPSTSSED